MNIHNHGVPKLVTWRAGVTLNAALVAGTIFSVLTAGLHAKGWAPIGLTSLALGSLVGLAAFGGAWMFAYGHRRGLVAVAALAGLFAAGLQHEWLYLVYTNQWRAARIKEPHLALFRPEEEPLGFVAYLRQETTPSRAALWTTDLALTALAAGATAYLLRRRRTFCGPCEVWYQTRWRGKLIDAPVLTDLAAPPDAIAILSACPHGCPEQLLNVIWTVGGETRHHGEFIVPSSLAT
jgi:hypothetical protein